MTIEPQNTKHLIADSGKVLRQLSSGIVLGSDVWLRKAFINGVQVDDFVENYEEIDAPESKDA